MTVAAPAEPPTGARAALRLVACVACAAALIAPFSAASAQWAGKIEVESDHRLRGYSLSEGRPAATIALAFDHWSGLYANATASALIDEGRPRLLGTQLNLGYSRALGPEVAIEAGLLRAEYRGGGAGRDRHYDEAYVGLSAGPASARIHYSPDYFRNGMPVLYGEAETGFAPAEDWRIGLHGGALAYLRPARPSRAYRDLQFDWSATLSRSFGALEIRSTLSGGGPGRDYYRARPRSRSALVLGASWAF